jgi:type II secretion system protein G
MRRPLPLADTSHKSPATRHFAGFTLIELLVVVAIIAILAALTLSTLGYVNKKSAISRAQAEVAALSSAIERYKLDAGSYPSSAAVLFTNLCGGSRVYFEPTPSMVGTNAGVVQFNDPWGTAYGYSNLTTYFELWSTAGGAASSNWIRN